MNSISTSKCPLEMALEEYKLWATNEISPFPLLDKESGNLTPAQEHKLMEMINDLMKPINKAFNRQFTASITPLACGDGIGLMHSHDKAILLFERNVRGKMLLAMPGGIADKGEDLATTARREFNEETGYGCSLESQSLALVRDFTLGGPLPRISAVYTGNGLGEPVANHEASSFKFFSKDDLLLLKEDQGFAYHIPMLQKVIELEKSPMADGSIYYCGLDRPFDEEAKSKIRKKVLNRIESQENPSVDEAIEKVEIVLKRYKALFKKWHRQILTPDCVQISLAK